MLLKLIVLPGLESVLHIYTVVFIKVYIYNYEEIELLTKLRMGKLSLAHTSINSATGMTTGSP